MDRSDLSGDSWPPTPGSPRPGSLYHATTTVDDLTLALTNYSRVPSPEPSPPLTCCCGSEDCDHTKSWLSFKSKLESRLILSAGGCLGVSSGFVLTDTVRSPRGRAGSLAEV